MKKHPLVRHAVKDRRSHAGLPVYAWSLGCPKNRADTEWLLGQLDLPVTPVASPARARLIFINTCAFIEPAVRESLRAIFDTIEEVSGKNGKPFLAVAGCLPGRYGIRELQAEIPEVDLWLDSHDRQAWPMQINRALNLCPATSHARIFSTPSYLWLKIADGCQHHCTFCTIPAIRGGLRSESAPHLLAEARRAIAAGISEIDLVAQDVTSWGRDLWTGVEKPCLADLVKQLAALPGLDWLRLLYLYPDSIDESLLAAMAEGSPILPYLDIPLQHSEKTILRAMGRPAKPARVLEQIRKFLPDAAIRTTLIVGFPGETDNDFQKLCEFVREARFYHVGVFEFWPEEGTAAALMKQQVPPEVAAERKAELMKIQAGISAAILADYVDKKMRVLVDSSCHEQWPGLHKGRVWFQAPEVDGITYISGEGVRPGAMVEAEIVDAKTYDLSALA